MIARVNLDRFQARLRRWVGAFEQGWGRLIADETLRMRGERDRSNEWVRQNHAPTRKPPTERR